MQQNSFKQVAYDILKEAGNPLHSKEITKLALQRGLLVTDGKTPEATMNAQLVVDINKKGIKSKFIKTAPSTFYLNDNSEPIETKEEIAEEAKKEAVISNVSSKQKGDIAEARVAELITLYGDNEVSCFKPISDDEGIDLIVKPKGQLKSLYIQIKSRFGSNPSEIFTATVKASGVVENYSMVYLFCYFDTSTGDMWDYVWLVPAPDFKRLANNLQGGSLYGFVAGRKKSDSNKWDQYLIHKTDLSESIINQLSRL
ncbi:MAG: HTH domain-containing protein [Candidatus Saccharimonadales bacterium]